MKRIFSKAISIMLSLLIISCCFPLNVKNSTVYADNYEYAWFPVNQVRLTQLSFENYSHSYSYHFDCVGANSVGSDYAFAPFTGKVVFITNLSNNANCACVGFQSLDKVHWADGSLDYMTVWFMHGSNAGTLSKGQIINQGTNFYKMGSVGASGAHYDIGVSRGQVNTPTDQSGHGVGNYCGCGSDYPYNAFYINRSKTPNIVNAGKLRGSFVGGPNNKSDWSGLWKDLGSTPGPTPTTGMTISGQTIPSGSLKKGSFFGIYGNITSNLPISLVWGGVYKSDWTVTSQYAEARPNTTSYSLYPYFDNNIVFNGLAEGSYHYLIKAKDTSGTEYTLINSEFTIGTPTVTSSMSISGQTAPSGTLQPGKFFAIKGIISSNLNITKVWGGVYNRGGSATAQYAEASPNSTQYDLSTYFDNKIIFNNLAVGYYTYKIQARDSSGKEYTLINSDFQIGNPKTLEFTSSATSVSLNRSKGEKKQITFSYANYDGAATISFEHGSNRVTNLEWGDWSNNSIPITIEGYANGTETFTVKLKNTNTGSVLASINITVTVTSDAFVFNASASSISISGFESKTVTFSYKNYDGSASISWEHGDNRATTLSWGEWSNNSIPLTITGYAKGTETITVNLKDSDSGKVLATKTVNVTVTGIDTKLNASTNSVSINMDNNEKKSVTFSYENVPASTNRMNIRYIHGDNTATTLEWGGWENHTTTLYITGYRTGAEDITIEFFDSETQEILAKQVISVKVTGTPQMTASANSVTLDFNAKTTKDVKISLSNFPYNCSLKCIHGSNIITSYKWNGWDNGTNTITLTPTAPGSETLTIQLVSSSNKVILSTKINVTVTAKFKITFDTCGGTANFTSKNVTFGDKYGALASATYDGYEFDGWFTEVDGGSLVTSETVVNIKSAQTLYAHWTKNPDPLSVSESDVALNVGQKYTIVANQSGLTYKSNNDAIVTVSPEGEITAIGKGNAIITVINANYEVVQIKVTVTIIEGDCDGNGVFDIDDVILLQQWLLAVPETDLANWKAADLCEDDRLDVFDLCMMKRLYAESGSEMHIEF